MFEINKLIDDNDEDENDINEDTFKEKSKHDLLIKEVKNNLTKKSNSTKWKTERLEVRPEIDDQGIFKENKKIIHNIDEILSNNDNKSNNKLLKNFNKKKILHQSTYQHVTDSIARKINFNELKESISKYDELVKQIRSADQLVFPAEDDRRLIVSTSAQKKLLTNDSSNESTTAISTLEKDIYETINKNDEHNGSSESYLNDDELQLLQSLNMEEARKLHREIQRSRVLMSYQEAKYRRIRKIKSKKYHRIKRKNKLKNAVEEFDKLTTTDSEKAIDKLNEFDRLRALERATLKHLNTGKWAKHQRIRAKYNDQSRNELNEQLKINQELMKKRQTTLIDDDNGDNVENETESTTNKLMPQEKSNISLDTLLKQPHNYCPWSSKLIQKSKNNNNDNCINDNKISTINNLDKQINLDKFHQNFDKMIENDDDTDDNDNDIDNDDKINLAKSDEHIKQLTQVFGDDNEIVEQFLMEKKQKQAEKVEMKTKYLPGWGTNRWSGYGIKESKRWKQQQIKRLERNEHKRNEQIGRAIFIDHESEIAKKYQCHLLTKKRSQQLKRPLGRTWNPELISKTLHEPRIIIRQGQIIEPMQPETLQTMNEKQINTKQQQQQQKSKRKPLS